MMKRAVKQIATAALLLLVFCCLCRLLIFNEYTVTLPVNSGDQSMFQTSDLDYHIDKPDVFELKSATVNSDILRVTIKPISIGNGFMDIRMPGGQNETLYLSVGPFNTVYDNKTGGFTGDSAVLIASTVFFLSYSYCKPKSFF